VKRKVLQKEWGDHHFKGEGNSSIQKLTPKAYKKQYTKGAGRSEEKDILPLIRNEVKIQG